MNPKQITILAVLVVAAGGALFLSSKLRDKGEKEGDLKRRGASAVEKFDVDSIDTLSIKGADDAVTLKKVNGSWTVEQRGGYAADLTKITRFLYHIKDLRIAESRTMKGEKAQEFLELRDPAKGVKGSGVAVSISGDNAKGGNVVFGKQHESGTGGGRYIKASDGAIYVVESRWSIETAPTDWLDREKFFKMQKIRSVSLEHEKPEDNFTLTREEENGTLVLKDAAEGEEVGTAKLGSIGNAFSNGRFADYIIGDEAKPENTGLDKPIKASFETFEGFNYAINLGKKTDDGKYFISYDVSAEIAQQRTPDPEPATPEGEEPKELTEAEKKQKEDEEKQKDEEFEVEKKRLMEKLEEEKKYVGNVYTVDSWGAEAVIKKRSDILMTEEEKKKAAEDAAKAAAEAANNPGGGGISATTDPVSVDPAVLKAERAKQEKALRDAEAARQMAAEVLRGDKEDDREGETGTETDPESDGDSEGESTDDGGTGGTPAPEGADE